MVAHEAAASSTRVSSTSPTCRANCSATSTTASRALPPAPESSDSSPYASTPRSSHCITSAATSASATGAFAASTTPGAPPLRTVLELTACAAPQRVGHTLLGLHSEAGIFNLLGGQVVDTRSPSLQGPLTTPYTRPSGSYSVLKL